MAFRNDCSRLRDQILQGGPTMNLLRLGAIFLCIGKMDLAAATSVLRRPPYVLVKLGEQD